jgi:hypothetical protein
MSETLATAYASLEVKLDEHLTKHAVWPSPDFGFALYALKVIERDPWPPFRIWDWTATAHRLSEAPILASAGYALSVAGSRAPAGFAGQWAEQVTRLSKRDPFPLDRESFFFRPQELLGIAVGVACCADVSAESRAWLLDVLQRGERRLESGGVWARTCGAVAAEVVGAKFTPSSSPVIEAIDLPELCLLRWAAQHVPRPATLSINLRDLDREILTRVFTKVTQVGDVAQAAVIRMAAGLAVNHSIESEIERAWAKPKGTRSAVELVTRLCRRFPFFVNQLQSRYAQRTPLTISDEYDVQDALNGILKLHFEDVRPEEATPSTGGSSSRIDFLLKRERVVVEAKMTRKSLDQKEVFKQLSEDIQRYSVHPDCDALVCFVYDPTGRCHAPAALENDLTKMHGSLEVAVVVEPKVS